MRLSLETTTGHSTGMSQQTLCPFRYDARMITPRPIVIVGAGYTGHWLYKLAGQLAVPAYASSRQPDQHLSAIAPSMRLRFDLADTATWSSLPPEADLIWTFPATPIEQVQAGLMRRILLILIFPGSRAKSIYARITGRSSYASPGSMDRIATRWNGSGKGAWAPQTNSST
jgi:hypothetical protein